MAIENEAVQAICAEVNDQFETLVNIMNDLADNGQLEGWHDGRWSGEVLSDGSYGYDLAGIELSTGTGDHTHAASFHSDPVDGTSPGTMLALSTGTSNQQLYTGQLGDLVTKAAAQKKAMNQKASQM